MSSGRHPFEQRPFTPTGRGVPSADFQSHARRLPSAATGQALTVPPRVGLPAHYSRSDTGDCGHGRPSVEEAAMPRALPGRFLPKMTCRGASVSRPFHQSIVHPRVSHLRFPKFVAELEGKQNAFCGGGKEFCLCA